MSRANRNWTYGPDLHMWKGKEKLADFSVIETGKNQSGF